MASPGKKAYPLRIEPAVWEAVARLAGTEMRSVNAQIEFLLRESLARRGVQVRSDAKTGSASATDPDDSH